jgi:hypothetical protein
MTGKRNEIPTTGLKYPMVDLFTGTVMPIVYLNTMAVSYLLLLTSPWLLMQAWIKELERERFVTNPGRTGGLESWEPLGVGGRSGL